MIVMKLSDRITSPEGLMHLVKGVEKSVAKGHKIVLVHGCEKQAGLALAQTKIKTHSDDGTPITHPKAMPIIRDEMMKLDDAIYRALSSSPNHANGGPRICQQGIFCSTAILHGKHRNGSSEDCSGKVDYVDERVLKHFFDLADVIVLPGLAVFGNSDDYGYVKVDPEEAARAIAEKMGAKLIVLKPTA